jgi:cytidylate kinase
VNLALYGRSGSGKSFVASILEKRFGYIRVSTGDLCRSVSRIMFGDEDKGNLNRISEKLREIDENIWIDAALRQVSGQSPVVFDSIRYISDHLCLTDLKFKTVRIVSESRLSRRRLEERGQVISEEDFRHRSEWEVDKCSFHATIMNDGVSAEQLTRQIESIISHDSGI